MILGRLLLGERRPIALAALLAAAAAAAAMGLAGASAYLAVRAAGRPPSALALLAPIAAVRGLALLRAGARYGERLAAHHAALRLVGRVRARALSRLLRAPPAQAVGRASGEWLRRVAADADRVGGVYADAVAPLLAALFAAGSAAFALPRCGGLAALAAGVGLAASALGAPALAALLGRAAGARLVAARGRLSAELVTDLAGMADLAGVDADGAARRRLGRLAAEVDAHRRAVDLAAAVAASLAALAAGVTAAFAAVACARAAARGALPADLAVPAVFVVVAALETARAPSGSLAALGEVAAAARRLLPDPGSPAPAPPRRLPSGFPVRVRDLGMRYVPHGPWALDGVSCDLPEGAHVLLIGPSGGGKSSLVHVLARLLPYQRGSVHLGGAPLEAVPERELRRRLAVCEQRPYLLRASVADNLRLARADAGANTLWRALEAVDLAERVAALPGGLAARLDGAGTVLSGGERRRLALARLIVADAPVWILDEPLAGLDEATAAAVAARLRELAGGRSVLWIAHDPVPVWAFDAVWRLADGRLAGADAGGAGAAARPAPEPPPSLPG
ncbi:MAG: thiol reductant ABC exporter subunit CydC [Firmicutes bacterium]|nr:thiol reductant ABC exporter subunit CydC [Bacillota bacterium]